MLQARFVKPALRKRRPKKIYRLSWLSRGKMQFWRLLMNVNDVWFFDRRLIRCNEMFWFLRAFGTKRLRGCHGFLSRPSNWERRGHQKAIAIKMPAENKTTSWWRRWRDALAQRVFSDPCLVLPWSRSAPRVLGDLRNTRLDRFLLHWEYWNNKVV